MAAFSSAVASASSDMSHAVTSAPAMSSAAVIAMHPLPVPMSRMRGAGFSLLPRLRMSCISPSVSGRGMSTPGRTANVRPQNVSQPRTYCTGSFCSRRAAIFFISLRVSSDNCLSLPIQMSVMSRPKRCSKTSRATLFASRSPQTGVRVFHSSLYVMMSLRVVFYVLMWFYPAPTAS